MYARREASGIVHKEKDLAAAHIGRPKCEHGSEYSQKLESVDVLEPPSVRGLVGVEDPRYAHNTIPREHKKLIIAANKIVPGP